MTLSGSVYIFTSSASNLQNYDPAGIRKVCFWLDNTSMTGSATQCDSSGPYDFAGSVNSTQAKPWNTTKVANATHTITQQVTLTTGGSEVDTASFTISNPIVTLSSTSLAFGDQLLDTSSAAQTVTLTDSGTAPLAISSIASTGDYAETNTCGTGITAGGDCAILVTFTPSATGSRSGSVSITDNAGGSPQKITLTGKGTMPSVSLSKSSLSFAGQVVGTSSGEQNVTLSNNGTAALTISGIGTTGDYSQSNNCGSQVAVSGKCTIQVTFTPSAPGTRPGSVSISDNATGSPQQIILTGTGTAPAASLSTTGLSFGNQMVGTSSPAQTVTLANTGTAPLTISGIASMGDYSQNNNCGTGLSVGGDCTIKVTFTPTTTGMRLGSVSITDNSTGSPQQIGLAGNGTAPAVSMSTSSLSFGGQVVGTPSAAQTVTLTNSGSAALTISGITSAGDYAQSNNCGTSVGVGGNCAIQVIFTPTAVGSRSGSVSVADTATGSPQQVSLAGTGIAALGIGTTSLAGGTVGIAYSASLTATGGTPSYSWSLASGALPAGLTLSTAGLISGIPTTAGTYNFTVQVSDSSSPPQVATKSMSILVGTVPQPLTISTASLANGTVGVSYSAAVSASGGAPAYSWSVIGGSWPAGLTLTASSGQISGTPSAAGNYNFTLQVTDSSSPAQTATQAYAVNIAANPPVITTMSLPDAVQNSAYSATLAASGGLPPYNWSLSSGTLPSGLTLSSTGTISGTATLAGPSNFTITVTDADNQTASQALTLTVDTPVAVQPTLVRRSSGSNSLTGQLSPAANPTVYYAYLPDGAQAGNTIVAAFQYDNSSTLTAGFSDDHGNSWQIACTELDTAHTQVIGWAYASSVAAGTRAVNLSLPGSNGVNDIAVHLFEFANIGAVDGCAGNFANSSSVTAGSITPTSSGDLLLAVMAKDNNDTQSTITAGSQSNITWQLATADLQDHAAMGVQWGVYSSTSAITPTMSTGGASNNSYVAASIAFKAATLGGTITSGIYINGILHFSRFSSSQGPGYTNPTTVGFPSYGNALVIGANGASDSTSAILSSITDTNNNTWTHVTGGYNPTGASTDEFWYCSPCTTGPNLVLTVTSAGSLGNSYNQTLMGYDISNAASSAFDQSGTATGDQTSYTGSVTGASVTPSTANGLVLCELDNWYNTVTGMSAGFLIDSEWYNNESIDGPENVDENNGWGHTYNSSTAEQTCVFTYGEHGTDAQQYWAAAAVSFKAQ